MHVTNAARDAIKNGATSAWLPADTVQTLSQGYELSIRELMLALIPLASEYAAPVLSGFHVGAVGRAGSGNLYFGANLEFNNGPLNATVHAEQAVVINAMMHGENTLEHLAISAPPCGYCRQFLYELDCAERLNIILEGKPDTNLITYLPGAFGPNDLGIEGGLMKHPKLDLSRSNESASTLEIAAFEAACCAYVPYTKSASGIALEVENGEIYTGTYIENAAFNPSLLPLQMAVSRLYLAGQVPLNIVNVMQVIVDGSQLDHSAHTSLLLASIAPNVKLQIESARFLNDT